MPPHKIEKNEGQRVVVGQRALQASSDVMLGWTDNVKAD
jgi:hypothetical protein